MKSLKQQPVTLAALALIACFGVFVLPLLLPPALLQGVSAANEAGFNNKIAAVAMALASIAALAYLCWHRFDTHPVEVDHRPLPRSFAAAVILPVCGLTAALSAILVRSEYLYRDDLDYFVNRVVQYSHYGRTLYDQIEFPYGPLLFYLPLVVQKLLFPLHLSVRAAYLVSLNGLYVLGLLLAAYLLNSLRISRSWKRFGFIALALETFQVNLGFNSATFRFLIPFACLAYASRRQQRSSAAISLIAGQMLCLATSPELGFAFLIGSLTFAAYRMFLERSLRSLYLALCPLLATFLFMAAFVWLSGWGYLRMLGLFSRGVYNFVVEPVPYVLIFFFAVVVLAPLALAREVRARSQAAPLLLALYTASLTLLPVALGRADPGHVLLDGMGFYLLSFVAISSAPKLQQRFWGAAVAYAFLLTMSMSVGSLPVLRTGLISGIRQTKALVRAGSFLARKSRSASALKLFTPHPEPRLDVEKVKAYTGGDQIVTPLTTSGVVQEQLLQANLLAPTFYFFQMAVLDRGAELREITEFDEYRWALLDPDVSSRTAEPYIQQLRGGPRLKQKEQRTPYVAGLLFEQNLKQYWRPVANINGYVLYHRV